MRRLPPASMSATLAVALLATLAACSDPTLSGGPGATEAGPPRLGNGFTLTAPGGTDGREPLLNNGPQPSLRGGAVIEGPPGTPADPLQGGAPLLP